MTLRMTRCLSALGLLSLVAAAPARGDELYAFDLTKKNPRAMRTWHGIVPAALKSKGWIYNFNGTSGLVETVTLHGRPFFFGSVCISHDCGGNTVAFLVAQDATEAFGAVGSDDLRIKLRYFGAPDPESQALLDRKLAE